MKLHTLPKRRAAAEEADLERDATELHGALSQLIRVYQFRDRDRICCHDLSVTQFYALAALVGNGPLTLNELAAELYLEKSSASRIADGLVERGYLDRRTHPEDRRAILLEPTAAGREMHDRIVAETIAEEKQLIVDFEPEVRQAMIDLITRLARTAASRVDASGGTCCRIPG